ncbi:MAG: hypothetical protein IKU60_02555 [Clostridia bacterium]|nr:hypothetical protein [Clostridia bacterium]
MLILIAIAAAVIIIACTLAEAFGNDEIFTEGQRSTAPCVDTEFVPTPKDVEYIKETKRVIVEALGEDYIEGIMELKALEERIDKIKPLCEALGELYELEDVTFELCYDEYNYKSCGKYSPKEKKILINTYFLAFDNSEIITDFIDTVLHECRHAVQMKMLLNYDKKDYRWYSGDKAVEGFAKNIRQGIITPKENIKAYREQATERDAYAMAALILAGDKEGGI